MSYLNLSMSLILLSTVVSRLSKSHSKGKTSVIFYRLLFAFMHLTAGILSLMLTALPEANTNNIFKEPTMEKGFHSCKDFQQVDTPVRQDGMDCMERRVDDGWGGCIKLGMHSTFQKE